MTAGRRALTLIETLLCCGLLSLLIALLSLVWIRGARAWIDASRLTQRLSQLQRLRHRLERELMESTTASLDTQVSPGVLCFASPRGLRSRSQGEHYERIPGTVAPAWLRYCLYWYRPDAQTLLFRELEIPAGDPARSVPQPLSTLVLAPATTALPISAYLVTGQVLLDHITRFEVSDDRTVVQLTAEAREAGMSQNPRTYRIDSTTELRN